MRTAKALAIGDILRPIIRKPGGWRTLYPDDKSLEPHDKNAHDDIGSNDSCTSSSCAVVKAPIENTESSDNNSSPMSVVRMTTATSAILMLLDSSSCAAKAGIVVKSPERKGGEFSGQLIHFIKASDGTCTCPRVDYSFCFREWHDALVLESNFGCTPA